MAEKILQTKQALKASRKKIQPVADLGEPKAQYGIEELKQLAKFMFAVWDATRETIKDGRFKAREVFNYTEALRSLPKAFRGLENLPAEVKDLDKKELEEIRQFIIDEFKLNDKELEQKVEDIISIAINFAKSLM